MPKHEYISGFKSGLIYAPQNLSELTALLHAVPVKPRNVKLFFVYYSPHLWVKTFFGDQMKFSRSSSTPPAGNLRLRTMPIPALGPDLRRPKNLPEDSPLPSSHARPCSYRPYTDNAARLAWDRANHRAKTLIAVSTYRSENIFFL
jgi:hypothetical protein